MKLKRKAKLWVVEKWKSKSKQSAVYEIEFSGFGNDLPRCIFFDILLRLPVKSVLICRYVSKNWRKMISDPDFAKLHYQKSQLQPMLYTNIWNHTSKLLLLVEVEQQDLNLRCLGCSAFDFCVHNTNVVVNSNDGWFINSIPASDELSLVNSCNGLLCLEEPVEDDSSKKNPVIICNPITGEFVKIPEIPEIDNSTSLICSGFGFNRITNQYKVVRMYGGRDFDPHTGEDCYFGKKTEVYTLGKGSWSYVGEPPPFPTYSKDPTYLNGTIHWFCYKFCYKFGSAHRIVSFDFESELFQTLPVLWLDFSCKYNFSGFDYMSMGVIKDCLCICDHSSSKTVDIWVMNDFGVEDSWTKTISISLQGVHKGLFHVIKGYENGAVMMFHSATRARARECLIYYDPESLDIRYFKVSGYETYFEAFVHVPSFISLKDILVGAELEMLNVDSR